MSLAWATLATIAAILPGLAVFLGFAARERRAQEVVRASAVGEVGLTIFAALLIHIVAWSILHAWGVQLGSFIEPLTYKSFVPEWWYINELLNVLWWIGCYILVTSAAGFVIGCITAQLVVLGCLRFLVTHKWAYELLKQNSSKTVVTAFVMTNIKDNGRSLMYKGKLEEFYLTSDGKFSYIILRNCSRYYMMLGEDTPITGKQLPLFRETERLPDQKYWNYLTIEGSNIANILFNQSPEVTSDQAGAVALENALKSKRRKKTELAAD